MTHESTPAFRATGVRRWGARVPQALLVAVLGLALLPVQAGADAESDAEADAEDMEDTQPPDDAEEIDAAEFEVLDATLDTVDDLWEPQQGSAYPLLLWSEGRRAYQIARSGFSGDPPDVVVPIDLDTLEPLTETVEGEEQRLDSGPLVPAGLNADNNYHPGGATIAIDGERGRMFFPHHAEPGACRAESVTVVLEESCLGGIHVLDLTDDALESLEAGDEIEQSPIPFQGLGVDGQPVIQSPKLRAMSYAPDLGDGQGKLHLLVEESGSGGVVNTSEFVAPHYAVQIDVASGATDWIETMPGCSASPNSLHVASTAALQEHYALFVAGTDDEPALYAGCYGPQRAIGSVGRLWLNTADADAAPGDGEAFPGPSSVVSIQADPEAQRVWLKSMSGDDEAWWVFDGGVSNYLGVVGIGERTKAPTDGAGRTGTLDPATGRLYVLESFEHSINIVGDVTRRPGGLFVVDGRRVPVPQASVYRDLPMRDLQHRTVREGGEVDYARDEHGNRRDASAQLPEDYSEVYTHKLLNPIAVDEAGEDRPRRLFVRPGQGTDTKRWYVIADHRPVADEIVDPEAILEGAVDDPPASDDVDLAEGLVRPTFTGTARGYGMRSLLLGGTDAALLPARADKIKNYTVPLQTGKPGEEPCGQRSREFGFAFSGSRDVTATLQPGSSGGAAVPMVMDTDSQRDLADPIERCGENQLDFLEQLPETLTGGLGGLRRLEIPGRDGADRPGLDRDVEEASCTAPEFDDDGRAQPSSEDSTGDDTPVGSTFTAQVRCEEDLSSDGQSRARFLRAGPVSVAEAYSEYDLTRDTETGGLVATAHAYARGVSIVDEVVAPNGDVGTSQVHIDLVETRAEAWAEGRSQPGGADDDCDRDRTAGTCLQRTLNGVTVVDGLTGEVYECDQCAADNAQMRAAMDSALGDGWHVNLREPDALLARGASNGTQAAIQKREIDEFADVVMKGDLLKTLPGLEMVRFNDNERGRGRQIYQFAGVELGSTYTRQCRGVIEGDQCVQPDVELAEVEVTLSDAIDGSPLEGGIFALHRDDEGTLADGLEALPGERSCTTDAQGSCSFVALEPGAYTLVQAGAPGDYSPTDEQVPLNLSPGSLFEVDVTNIRAIGEVEVSLTDLDEQPLGGGVFELYADADTDGTIGLDDPQAATCTTDPSGTCTMSGLPLGAYVLRQAASPEGFEPVDDEVGFALDQPGQVATAGFANAPTFHGGTDAAVDDGQTDAPRQGSFNGVERSVPMPNHQPVAVQGPQQPQVAADRSSGGPSIIQGLQDAPGDLVRMIRRSPGEAAGFAALAMLAAAAVNGPVRRRLLTHTTA